MEYQTYAISQEIAILLDLIKHGEIKTHSDFYETQQNISWLKRLTDREADAIRKEDNAPTMGESEIDWFKEQIGNNILGLTYLKDEFNTLKTQARSVNKIKLEV